MTQPNSEVDKTLDSPLFLDALVSEEDYLLNNEAEVESTFLQSNVSEIVLYAVTHSDFFFRIFKKFLHHTSLQGQTNPKIPLTQNDPARPGPAVTIMQR